MNRRVVGAVTRVREGRRRSGYTPDMLRRILFAVVAAGVVLVLAGTAAYIGNATPEVPPIGNADEAGGRPWVVKLHARWCPVCMVTKDVWAGIEAAYGGRVNLLVLDFTNEATTTASEAEARRLGLDGVLRDYYGASGIVLVLDTESHAVRSEIAGSLDWDDYTAAIDAAIAREPAPTGGVPDAARHGVMASFDGPRP